MSDLVAFLIARLDEDQAAARRMLDGAEPQVWPWEVWVTPGIRGDVGAWDVAPSVATAEYAPKRYRRLWGQADSEYPHSDDGWLVHESAICVWSEDVAKRALREVEAKRSILADHERVMQDMPWERIPPSINCARCSPHPWPCPTVLALAAVYSDHPDYWLAAAGKGGDAR